MKKVRLMMCLVSALVLLVYAVPRLPVRTVYEPATGFSLIWLAFALVVVGANLYHVMEAGEDDRRKKRKRGERKRRESPTSAVRRKRATME